MSSDLNLDRNLAKLETIEIQLQQMAKLEYADQNKLLSEINQRIDDLYSRTFSDDVFALKLSCEELGNLTRDRGPEDLKNINQKVKYIRDIMLARKSHLAQASAQSAVPASQSEKKVRVDSAGPSLTSSSQTDIGLEYLTRIQAQLQQMAKLEYSGQNKILKEIISNLRVVYSNTRDDDVLALQFACEELENLTRDRTPEDLKNVNQKVKELRDFFLAKKSHPAPARSSSAVPSSSQSEREVKANGAALSPASSSHRDGVLEYLTRIQTQLQQLAKFEYSGQNKILKEIISNIKVVYSNTRDDRILALQFGCEELENLTRDRTPEDLKNVNEMVTLLIGRREYMLANKHPHAPPKA